MKLNALVELIPTEKRADVYSSTSDATVHEPSVLMAQECMQYMTHERSRHLPVLRDANQVALVPMEDPANGIISSQDPTLHDLEDCTSGEYSG